MLFKFILASLATNNIRSISLPLRDRHSIVAVLNGVVSFLDNMLWNSLAFLLIQKSSSRRAYVRAFVPGFIFASILCIFYGYAFTMGEPEAWNLSAILLLIYYGARTLISVVLVIFMWMKRGKSHFIVVVHTHSLYFFYPNICIVCCDIPIVILTLFTSDNRNRWRRWGSLRFLTVFLIALNTSYLFAVIAMSLKNTQTHPIDLNLDSSNTPSALLDVCWFTLVELVRNLIQPFVLYGTLLKDTDYWRKLAKLITMSSTIEVPKRNGTLDLSFANYRDIEAFARTTRVPVLDFADFELKGKVGKGATASVYRAYYRGYPVACMLLLCHAVSDSVSLICIT